MSEDIKDQPQESPRSERTGQYALPEVPKPETRPPEPAVFSEKTVFYDDREVYGY